MADVGAETLEESQERIDRGLSGLGRLLVAMARLARERGEVGLLDSLRTAEEALRTAECLSAHAYRLLTDVFSISGLEHVVEDRRRNVEAAAVADAGQALAKAEELVQLARTALGVVVVGLFDQRGHAVIEVCGLELALAFAEEGWLDAVAGERPKICVCG